MKRIIKCGTAFLLALVLCLCLLPTTAFAASKQVYIWNFPLSDDTLKSSGNWGHGVLNLRFGYRVGASSYTQFRCLDSWQGEVAYCIEPGAPQKNYDSITDHDDTWWDHLSLPDGHPLTPREVQRQIGRIMSYGYHGTIGGGCMEAAVVRRALEMIHDKDQSPILYHGDLTGQDAEDDGMVCGGVVDILMERV